ncbi:HNH endonuclease signature motif containing protein [Brevibacterium siliguriense]|uniref:HNH endonuclease signature motif containing protein n=1 Tax=Brevibacterium siliguriense TaxID=1136497 RepID=UPI001E4DA58B|nr:HNH endonuclease signature motif containing protein [Brevibacterium siliguriense]
MDKRVAAAINSDDCIVDVPADDVFSSLRPWTRREALAWTQAVAQVESEIGAKVGAITGRKKNRATGRQHRRVRKLAEQFLIDPTSLPDFPGYDPKLTFFTWLRGNIEPTEAGVYSSLLGATTSNSLRHMTSSMTLVHGLPQFLKRCLDGDFTIEHVDYVTRACRDLHFEHLPELDDYLTHRRADITIETFKRSVALKIAVIQPAEDTLKSVSLRRRVDFSTGDGGTAYLTLSGPTPELQACFRRLDAFARAVHKNNTSAFSNQLKAGDCFDEERSISALMFDILTRTRPQMKLRIIRTNDTDNSSTSTDFPLDGLFAGPDGTPMHEGESLLDYIERVFDNLDQNGCAGQTQSAPVGSGTTAYGDTSRQASVEHSESEGATRSPQGDSCQAHTAPADRTFESQLLEAILGSNSTTDRDTSEALSALVGSRASGARPAAGGTGTAVEGSGTSASRAVDAFGNPILDMGERRISFEFLLDMPTNEYWLANQASTFITVPLLTLLSQFQSDDDDPPPLFAPVDPPPPTTDPPSPPPLSSDPPNSAWPTERPTQALDSITPPASPKRQPSALSPEPPASHAPLSSSEVCDLAGMLPNGSPIPADMARRVAGYSTTWTRLLTDPATGTPVDAKAMTYAIPNSVRKTLVAQFVTCTFPGCTQPAEVTEVDHIDPFNHSDPTQGGLTRFGNLHCLCKAHHLQKTNGNFDVRMTEPGHLEYVFRRGVTAEVVSPDNPISVEHARLFLERFGAGLSRAGRAFVPKQSSTDDPLADESGPPNEHESDVEGDSDSVRQSDSETTSAHNNGATAKHPVPGDRKQARECPEPAAADGTPGWRELVAEDLCAFTPTPALGNPDATSDAPTAAGDSSELRDWFWDSGEPPPF